MLMGRGEVFLEPWLLENKLQIPQNHKNRPNVLRGFQVLYPSVIVTRGVMLCPLLRPGPLCCVRQTISHVTPGKVHRLPEFTNNTTETKKMWQRTLTHCLFLITARHVCAFLTHEAGEWEAEQTKMSSGMAFVWAPHVNHCKHVGRTEQGHPDT